MKKFCILLNEKVNIVSHCIGCHKCKLTENEIKHITEVGLINK